MSFKKLLALSFVTLLISSVPAFAKRGTESRDGGGCIQDAMFPELSEFVYCVGEKVLYHVETDGADGKRSTFFYEFKIDSINGGDSVIIKKAFEGNGNRPLVREVSPTWDLAKTSGCNEYETNKGRVLNICVGNTISTRRKGEIMELNVAGLISSGSVVISIGDGTFRPIIYQQVNTENVLSVK